MDAAQSGMRTSQAPLEGIALQFSDSRGWGANPQVTPHWWVLGAGGVPLRLR